MSLTISKLIKAKNILDSNPKNTVPCPCCGTECYVFIRKEESIKMAKDKKITKKAVKKMKK